MLLKNVIIQYIPNSNFEIKCEVKQYLINFSYK